MERSEDKEKLKTPGSRKVFYILISLLGVILLLVAGRLSYVVFMDPMSAFKTPKPVATALIQQTKSPETAKATLTPTPQPTLSPEEELNKSADLSFMQNKVNILMLGWDQSPEREEEGSSLYRDSNNNYRSDVLILLTADFDKNQVHLISIPRDTYAPIYNTKGRYKINAAFALGGSVEGDGFNYAMRTVEDLLGVPIDYYAGVDMIGLKSVVDAMGGVNYDVDVKITLNGRVLEKGYQHLDGQQVLDYCRARKGISTDVGRADRQQRMLFAIFEQLKSKNQLINLPKIYSSVQDKVETNLNTEQIAALTVFAMGLDMDDLKRYTLEGSYVSNVYNASFYVLKNDKLKSLVKSIFGIDIKTNSKYDLNYVEGDRQASVALPYISGAEYMLSLVPVNAPGSDIVESCLNELKTLTEKSVEVSGSGKEEALSKIEIESAQHKLLSAILNLCRQNNLTKANVLKGKIPADVYNMLPDPANSGSSDDKSEEDNRGLVEYGQV